MKKIIPLAVFAILLAACGDTIETESQTDIVATLEDLPKCTKDNESDQAFVKEDAVTRICVDGNWVPMSGSLSADFSCKAVELKDKSGVKIVCNGDSIGVVLNGKDGVKGDAGEDGKDGVSGTGCSITDRSDTAIVVTCGDSTMTIDLGVALPNDTAEADSERTPISLDSLVGFTQKGPFLKGSTVYLYELSDGRTLKQTNGNFTSNITRDDGRYKFLARDLVSQYAMLVVDGYYRNEVTGRSSNAQIRLKAITDMRKRSSVNVNLLTHLEFERVYHLVTRGDSETGEKLTVKQAKHRAQQEILEIFDIQLGGSTDAEDMDVFGSSDADAALLAISILLQGDRTESELMALLAEISSEIAETGKWAGERADSIKVSIADWAFGQDLRKFRRNVEGWKLGGKNGKVGDFESFINNFIATTYGIEVCRSGGSATVTIQNERSVFNGRPYECREWEGVVTWIDFRAEKTCMEPSLCGLMLDWRDRRIYNTVSIELELDTVVYRDEVPDSVREFYSATWMAENLDYEYRVEGEPYGNYCYNDDCNSWEARTFGRYYTWAAAMDSAGVYSGDGMGCGNEKSCNAASLVRGVCPEGWHLPSKTEWSDIVTITEKIIEVKYEMDGPSNAGAVFKSQDEWIVTDEFDGSGYDDLDFTALPAGFWFRGTFFDELGAAHDGNNYEKGESAYFWTSTANGYKFAYNVYFTNLADTTEIYDTNKFFGYSVRCLKD